MGKYFGTDGFRGEAGDGITSEQAFAVGRFLGYYFKINGGGNVVVGKDTRLSCYTLEYALVAGITASGGNAYIMHVTTTPSVSFAVRCGGFDCGVMISASHNPYCDNGIKIVNRRGEKMEESVLSLIEEYIDGRRPPLPFARGKEIGRAVDFVAGRNRYIGHLISLSACSYKGMRVGLDCANGSGYKIAQSVFEALGATVYCVGAEPDGTNINGGVGSTDTAKLQALVRDKSLDIGFAFDGDADRCICVDERGRTVDGDGLLYAGAVYLKGKGELNGDKIVATVMSNGGLEESLKEAGISVVYCPVGDRFVYEKMCAENLSLGGEQSGHIIFGKVESTGDGLVTAVMTMENIIENGLRPSELVAACRFNPQMTISVSVADKYAVMRSRGVRAVIDGLIKEGKTIVRASGTENVIRITAERKTEEECDEVCREIERAVRACGEGGVCAE